MIKEQPHAVPAIEGRFCAIVGKTAHFSNVGEMPVIVVQIVFPVQLFDVVQGMLPGHGPVSGGAIGVEPGIPCFKQIQVPRHAQAGQKVRHCAITVIVVTVKEKLWTTDRYGISCQSRSGAAGDGVVGLIIAGALTGIHGNDGCGGATEGSGNENVTHQRDRADARSAAITTPAGKGRTGLSCRSHCYAPSQCCV